MDENIPGVSIPLTIGEYLTRNTRLGASLGGEDVWRCGVCQAHVSQNDQASHARWHQAQANINMQALGLDLKEHA